MNEHIQVGDVIWIIDADRHTVIPARVNEQIVSKSINGEVTYHHIEFPSGKKQKLENLNAAWYANIEGVRNHLLQRAKDVVDKTIGSAKDVAQKKFNIELIEDSGFDNSIKLESEAMKITELSQDPDSVKVSLADGQVVNVKVPPEFLDENFSS